MIGYRDFVPATVEGKWYEGAKLDSFDSAVAAANEWLRSERVSVLSVETVVLPNVHDPNEGGTSDSSLGTASGWASWNQFVRVWYTVDREG